MLNDFLKFLTDNKDALGLLFGSGVVIALMGGIFKFVQWLMKESRLRKTRSDENFPFKIIPPNSNVAKEILGGNDDDLLADRNIPYQQRVANRNIRREIEDSLSQNHWVLITGKTGLGKTREAVHVAESLNKERWTVLYLTRERWLSAPSKLPAGVPERKLIFILDDLNRKIYASRVEQSPQAEENLLQPLNIRLQTRIHETLKVFEALCGKNEIMVIATARDEKFSEFPDEPSEWDKLEFNKHDNLWKKFFFYALSEPDDDAEVSLLSSTVRAADIKANSSDFNAIAKRNDGTFSNLVENMRTASYQNLSLQENTFRDTLKGTWEKRYKDAVTKNQYAKYYYDSVDLVKTIAIDTSFYNIFSIASILAEKDPTRFNFIKNFRTLQELAKKENILNPRDGQIEAKGYKVDVQSNLSLLYEQIYYSAYQTASIRKNLLIWLFIPKSTLSTENITALERFLALFTNLGSKLNQLGVAYGELGFQEIEIHCYKKSIGLSKWDITSHRKIRLGIVQWANLGYAYRKQQEYGAAAAAYQEATKLDPNNVSAWNGLGIAYSSLNRIEEAIAAYKKANEIDSNFAYSWSNLGNVYRDLKRYDDAITVYQRAIDINPKVPHPWNGLGYTYLDLKRYDDAITVYQKAIELDPKTAYPWNELGKTYYEMNQYDDAISACQKAIELDPKAAYPWNGLGIIYRDLNRYDDAIAAYQKTIELNPKAAYPWNGLGTVYHNLNRYDDAIAAYQKAIELNPKYTNPWHGLGTIYTLQREYEKALDSYQKAVELAPDDGIRRSSLAGALRRLRRDEEASQQIEIARSLIGKENEYFRARLDSICGNTTEALRLLKFALDKIPASLNWARQDPDFDNIRDDPRFKELVGLE